MILVKAFFLVYSRIKKFTVNHVYKLLFIVFLTLLSFQINAGTFVEKNKLKAALLFKLIQFIEWPEKTEYSILNHFGLCVLGRDDFGVSLDFLNGRKINDHNIEIRRFKKSQSVIKYCQLVFISKSKEPFLQSILLNLQQHPILTISDSSNFAKKGGMIQLVNKNRHFSFIINLKKVQMSGLKISAPLLQLSTIVESDRDVE